MLKIANKRHAKGIADSAFRFLIVGAGRGGTSLLAGLMDYHDQLEVGFEKFTQEFLMGKTMPDHEHDTFSARVALFLSACKNESRHFPGKMYGNKITTEHIYALEDHNLNNAHTTIDVLDMFFNSYLKDIKIIFILRDGRTCVRSKVLRTGQPVDTACARWRYSVNVYRFLLLNHHNNMCIKYEDLLFRPEEILRDLCDFLEIPYQDSMLHGTKNPKMLPAYKQNSFDTSKINLADIPHGCFEQIYDELKYCGYCDG